MKPVVLFVDDDALLLQGLVRLLIHEPYDVRCALGGEAALATMRREQIDILVSDEQMPGMPGSDLIAQAHEEFPETVAILMSGQSTVGSLVHALNHGHVFRVLLKPCRTEEITSVVRLALLQQAIWKRSREALPLLRQLGDLLAEVEHTEHQALLSSAPVAAEHPSDLGAFALALDAELTRARTILARR
jgi:two-component system, probable response regulator PhcQ